MIQLVKGQTIQSILNIGKSIREHFSAREYQKKIQNYHNSLGRKNSLIVDLIINK